MLVKSKIACINFNKDDFSGKDLVNYSMQHAIKKSQKIEILIEIVGRIVDKFPESERIDICALSFYLEQK